MQQQSAGSISNRQCKSATDVNNELKLNGDKIILEDRRFFKENYTASSKALHLSRGPARPSSAIPMLRLYKKNDDFEPSFSSTRRPFSAENLRQIKLDNSDLKANSGHFSRSSLQSIDELDQHLPSTELLKTILNDSSDTWGVLKKTALINQRDSQLEDCEQMNLSLKPGLAKKPPIPKKSTPELIKQSENKDQLESKPQEINDTLRSDCTDYSNRSNLELLEDFTKKYEAIEEKLVENRSARNNQLDFKFDKYVSPVTFTNRRTSGDYMLKTEEIKPESNRSLLKEIEKTEHDTNLLFQTLKSTTQTPKVDLNPIKSNPKQTNVTKSKVPTPITKPNDKKFTQKLIPCPKDSIKEQPTEIDSWISKEKMLILPACSPNNDVDTWILENSLDEHKDTISNRILREFLDTPELKETNTIANQDVLSNDGSTYDEIASILELLEGETKKSQNKMIAMKDIISTELCSKVNQNSTDSLVKYSEANVDVRLPKEELVTVPVDEFKFTSTNYNELLSYLDEVDKNCSKSLTMAKERVYEAQKLLQHTINLDTVPKVKDLLTYTKDELAQQVIDQTLHLKEKSSSVNLLQSELSSLRDQIIRMTKEGDQIIKQKIRSHKEDCESVVKRHQKFIDQLIADKKKLSEQYETLLKEMKAMEDRFESNVRALDHKHKVDLQKVRDMQLAAEKARRDKWIDTKTKRIKEMTVKSIEPELQSMNLRQQKELSDLRCLHKEEIEDLELKAARKMQEQCERLREQLTNEREKALGHEKEVMRVRYDKLVESEEKGYQEQRRRLLQEHANRLAECEEREANALIEKDKAIKTNQEQFEDKLQAAIRRHNSELQLLKERTELELETWQNNYRKQQSKQLIDKETAIRESCRKERDRDIEAVIERLETEAVETKQQIEESTENRIRRLREKFEKELRDLECSEKEAQSKCSQFKVKVADGEDQISSLRGEMKQLETQLQEYKELYNKLLTERNNVKDIIQGEMKSEVEALKTQIRTLQDDKDNDMQQVCGRVKVALARKDEIISEITRDNGSLQEKCKYLESMLNQQRKDYLIK